MQLQLSNSIQSIFSIYANPRNSQRLTLSGVIVFYSILDIDVERDSMVLYIAYQMECKCMYIITKEDIQRLSTKFQIETFADLKNQIQIWREDYKDITNFKPFYRFLFMYTVRSQQDNLRKRLHLSNAIQLWKILFESEYVMLDEFCYYLQSIRSEEDGIRQDEWNMIFEFLLQFGKNKNWRDCFNSNDAWPLLLCEFAKWQVS